MDDNGIKNNNNVLSYWTFDNMKKPCDCGGARKNFATKID
jgi:hypothetical protein